MGASPLASRGSSRGAFGAARTSFQLINNTGYSTEDLRRFCIRGLQALKAKVPKRILFVAAPQRSRGCADVGPGCTGINKSCKSGEAQDIVIALAPPNRFSMRRLSRLFEHEVTHTQGYEHEDMPRNVMWSLGPVPDWAKDLKIRYLGRAPNQIP